MSVGRRLLLVAIVAAAVAAPAIVLRVLCIGRACDRPTRAAASVPFCSLPERVRTEISNGFHEDRSPEVLAVTGDTAVAGGSGVTIEGVNPPWPSVQADGADRVPLAFHGTGVDASARIPKGTTLADVAPTIAEIIGVEWKNPNVHSGQPIPGVANGDHPRLVLLLILKGLGSRDVQDRSSIAIPADVATRDVRVGSAPLDPAAAISTIGTGGRPSEHGITGTLLRGRDGGLVRAWGTGAPPSIIAALGDDLDLRTGGRAKVGIAATDVSDRGAIGRNWYFDAPHDDDVLIGSGEAGEQWSLAGRIASRGYGRDAVPDLLAVVFNDDPARVHRSAFHAWEFFHAITDGSLAAVVTATGADARAGAVPAGQVQGDADARIPADEPLIQAAAVGGVFVGQEALVRTGLTSDAAVQALLGARTADGRSVFADAFAGRAVTFARYC